MSAQAQNEGKNRLLQESYTHGNPRHVTGSECEELARKAMVLYPDLPYGKLADKAVELADAEFLAALDQVLRARHLIRTFQELRRREYVSPESWLFPEIQDSAAKLPRRVPVGKKKTVERGKVCYEDLENYLKVLNQRDRARHQKRIAAVMALMELWPPRTKKLQGITLAEVDALKAKRAGLL